MKIEKTNFGKTPDNKDVFLYTLSNSDGMRVSLSEYAAAVVSVMVKDRNGNFSDVALGYDDVTAYFDNPECFGVTIGRSANRIEGASFEIDGSIVRLAENDGSNNLHSGTGFQKKLWVAVPDEARNRITMNYTSPDGEDGFPGRLDMKVVFTLNNDNSLSIHYLGVSDKKTLINCTNHSYFNLAGHGAGLIEDEYIRINAARYTPVKENMIPSGAVVPVEGTPFDFRQFRRIGVRIEEDDEQIRIAGGFDHNFVLDGREGSEPAAVVEERTSGRRMEVYTDLPGIQFYTGNYIREGITGKGGAVYGRRCGLALETQYFPNSVNQPEFKSPLFGAGVQYSTTTVYKFRTM